MQSPPVTPKRKRRSSDDDYFEEPISVQGSAQKKAKMTPQTPSKSALARAEAAKKREWKAAWNKYAQSSYWEKDDSYRQKVNTFEIHRSDAMQFYRLKAAEMDTLPYWEFENKNYPSHPGRSYSHEGVLMLVSRKHAMLSGLHEKGLREHELLRQGKELFDKEYEQPGVYKSWFSNTSQASTAAPTNAQQEKAATPVENCQPAQVCRSD
ncbi:hypothetical protein FJTKL_00319 [Diaporthe vaccinii]|uniref:Uncharacterized protein n=1 Tax=Diaporthe vaccinii TaxID=105482 RepID=A0ABR4E3K5_9PEZI